MKNTILNIFALLSMLIGVSSCSDFLDTLPTDSVVDQNAMKTIYDAEVVTNGLYTELKYYTMYGSHLALMGDMRADNLYPREIGGYGATIYTLEYDSETDNYFSLWDGYYTTIMRANSLIKNISTLEVSSDSDKAKRDDFLGQAYAVRALCYFDIARLYGMPYLYDNGASLGAVIVTTPLLPEDAQLPRSTVAETYAQINSDLNSALPLLSREKNKGHFNYWAAKLLQSRVSLYSGKYQDAYDDAVEVIEDSPYRCASNSDYLSYWGVEGNDESVLELLVSIDGDIDDDGGFITMYHQLWFDDPNAGGGLIPTKRWRALFNETPNDVRAQMIQYDNPDGDGKKSGEYWLKKFIGNKDLGYTFRRNNPKVLRITEAFLIAAEAGVHIGAIEEASGFLNVVRERADPSAIDVVATLDLVQLERQKEFIGEGHRFFDLMRCGEKIVRDIAADPYDYAGGAGYKAEFSWDYYKVALPISSTERLFYKELQQNLGYK